MNKAAASRSLIVVLLGSAGCAEPAPCPDGSAAGCGDAGVVGEGEGEAAGEGEGEAAGEGEGEAAGEGEGEGPVCADEDSDGFYSCVDPAFPERPTAVDCDDGTERATPGGVEFPGNERDDDCDGAVDEPEPACVCDGDADDLLAGIGLCGERVAASFVDGEPGQNGGVERYFGLTGPNDDGCFAVMTTGVLDAEVINGDVSTLHFTDFEDPLTGALLHDRTSATVALRVPANARGFELDLMFVTVEWPDFLCEPFNDAARVVIESDAIADRAPTNIAIDGDGNLVTVNAGFFELPTRWTTDLSSLPHVDDTGGGGLCGQGTPVEGCALPAYCSDGSDISGLGSGTGWLKVRAPVRAGETILLTFETYDVADASLDSVTLFDGFRWLPAPPPLGAVKEVD